ncbi:hypothetical protein M431DRAFT_460890 [Trichoderma harzianum CBS 226.95]|uniref:Uncharacterized protein n=1 Tax=Trichoderma harzianum CBS 226.95 TaxID=983964 RepID=A0A2T4A8N3_TRIHA|nr:hypothetical protein M431DRAFT_460890 [Trichoderma harzianum CBS 226.95]PTB53353.1 hypothetical protein M431DRAFT_460890 [Trichoderma harzianum CBS 226.95]
MNRREPCPNSRLLPSLPTFWSVFFSPSFLAPVAMRHSAYASSSWAPGIGNTANNASPGLLPFAPRLGIPPVLANGRLVDLPIRCRRTLTTDSSQLSNFSYMCSWPGCQMAQQRTAHYSD